jgi:isocitrate/isopropylmalate dehydrogenase
MDFRIAVFAGDGIGPEVIEACLAVLERLDWRRG